MRLGALNPEEPFSGITMPVEIRENKGRVNEVIENSRKHFAMKYEPSATTQVFRRYKKVSKPKSKTQAFSTLP